MPKSKSKSNVRAASLGGLPRHPALNSPDCMLQCRMGSEVEMRLPDEHAHPTASTVLPDDLVITPNADGDFVHIVHYRLGYINQVVTAGTTAATSTVVNSTRYTSFTAAAALARTVCTKVQIMYVGAEQTAAGYISVSQKTQLADVQSFAMSQLHNNAEKQFRAQEGFTGYITYRQIPRFEDPGATAYMYGTFPILVIAGSGLPASAVIKIRVLRFVEYQPKEGDLTEGSVDVEPYNPGALAVHSQLGAPHLSMHTGTEHSSFLSKLKSAANAAYHIAQPMLPYVVKEARTQLQRLSGNAFAAAMPLMLTM